MADPAGAGDAASDAAGGPPPADADPRPLTYRRVFAYAAVATLGVVLVLVGARTIFAVRGLLVQVFVAAFIAVSLDPAVRWLIAHKVKRSRAVALVVAVFLLLLGGFGYATIPALVNQATQLGRDFPGYLQHLREQSPSLARLEDRFHLQPKIEAWARRAPSFLTHEAFTVGTRFFGALLTTLLVVVLTVYFMADLPRLERGVVRLFPKRHRANAANVVAVMVDKVGAYMIGNLIISLIAGVAAFIALISLRVPFSVPLAVAVAITDLIPLIGATLGAAICVVVAFATTDLWPNTVVLVIFFVLYQQFENYLIAPRVLRNTVELPSVAVLLVALIGASMLGIVGALIAIPIAASVRVVLGPILAAGEGPLGADDGPPPSATGPPGESGGPDGPDGRDGSSGSSDSGAPGGAGAPGESDQAGGSSRSDEPDESGESGGGQPRDDGDP